MHVRAGSIVPVGPELEYTDEKPADPVTLYVYAGADGVFTLYDDDGISNEYEKGASTRIRMTWDDGSKTLTIGAREGSYPGMLATRTFRVVLVTPESPSPFLGDAASARTVTYDGTAATVDLAGAEVSAAETRENRHGDAERSRHGDAENTEKFLVLVGPNFSSAVLSVEWSRIPAA